MTADEGVVAVIAALESADVPYMIVGSLASNFHGIPRSTRDADFVIELVAGGLARLESSLPPELTLDAQSGFETVTGSMRYVIHLAHSPFICELFVRSDDAHDRERFARKIRVQVLGRSTWVATAEDMIVTKLRWARDARRTKDREDVRNILALRRDGLDWTFIHRWAGEHGTRDLLDDIRASLPQE